MSKAQRRSLRDAAANKTHSNPRTDAILQQATAEPKKQIHAYIPESLHTRFKMKTVREGRKMSEVLEEMIESYVGDL